MGKERLAAFSDGVVAIIITIMVLELKAPHGADLAALAALAPIFLSYVLSFIYVAIYWHNHHHMLQLEFPVNGGILWANTHLLFWLSLFPFTTAWLDENRVAALPAATYGFVLAMAAVAYFILQETIARAQGPHSTMREAIGQDRKGKVSPILYLLGVALAFVDPRFSVALYVGVAVLWLVPDRRVARTVAARGRTDRAPKS